MIEIAYLCNKQNPKCEECYEDCHHTLDPVYAKNQESVFVASQFLVYFEGDGKLYEKENK